MRHRPHPDGGMEGFTLGSGFFISPDLFLTCHHVINAVRNPHREGDTYHLVNNVAGAVNVIVVENVTTGDQLNCFPEVDLALLRTAGVRNQPHAVLDFGSVPEGVEIGVAGYPLPRLQVADGVLSYENLIYRVAKNVVTANYSTGINTIELPAPIVVPVLEVNFLFVSGNSGGPIFRAESGVVVGFVHGFVTHTVAETIQQVSLLRNLPEGMPNRYVQNVHALYSLGIKLDCTREMLQRFGVSV